MKITKILFKNINSFYGEHPPIDFTVDPLSATGLFMISGPTGAGKSTLLDVISLALFNQIPRFSVKSLNSKQIAANGSVINLIAAEETDSEAYAEVEYEVKGLGYRSRWSISKNRNGKWREYDMEVSRLSDDEIISNKKSDAPVLNEGLIGLKYGQFIQSIVLSQGNFAEFLRAKEKERSKLLEDITGTHIYRKLGAAAFQKNKAAQEEIKSAEKQLENIELLTEEQRNERNSELNEKLAKVKSLQDKIEYFRTQYELKKNHEKVLKSITAIKSSEANWQIRGKAFEPDRERLSNHSLIADLVTPINDFENLLRSISEKKQEKVDCLKNQQRFIVQQNELIERAAKLFNEPFDKLNFETLLRSSVEKITEIDRKIGDLKSAGLATSTTIKSTIEEASDEVIANLNPSQYTENINRLIAYESEITSNQFSEQDINPALLEKLDQRINSLNKWHDKIGETKEVISAGKEEKAKLGKLKENKQSKEKELTTKQLELEVSAANYEKLKKEKEDKRNSTDLNKLRETLTDGEPCPLCGSTQHPYHQHVAIELGDLEIKLLKEEKHLQDLTKTANDVQTGIKVIESQIENAQVLYSKYIEQYKTLKKQCDELAQAVNLPTGADEKAIELEIKKSTNERQKVNQQIQQKSTLATITLLKKLTLENQNRLVAFNKIDTQRKAIYTGDNFTKDQQELNQNWNRTEALIQQLSTQLEQLTIIISQAEKQVVTSKSALKEQLSSKGFQSVEEAKKQLIEPTELRQLLLTKEALEKEKNTLETQFSSYEAQRKELVEKLIAQESAEELQAKFEEIRDTVNELNKSIGQLQNILSSDERNRSRQTEQLEQISILRKNAQKWNLLNNYIGDANGDKYCNFAQSLTLNNLIGLANQRLNKLSDRYLLSKLDQDFDSLRVVDLYQGNAKRSVDTLSGGETFTLSLAMALALSDMASQNVKLDSLFIDEGFGTLDGESLEAAIATLERLQHDTQKTIGIISHRQELMDRVSTQVVVTKGNDGKSTVSVKGF